MTNAPPHPSRTLPDVAQSWIAREGGSQALLLITVDGQIRPHVAMLARDEVFVAGATRLRVACAEGSRSALNLRERGSVTLSFFDADLACSIKGRVVRLPHPLLPGVAAMEMEVEEVKLDAPRPTEGEARLATGLRFEGRPPRPDIQDALRKDA